MRDAIVRRILVSSSQGLGFFLAPWADSSVPGRVGLNYLTPFTVASVSAWMANRGAPPRAGGTAPALNHATASDLPLLAR